MKKRIIIFMTFVFPTIFMFCSCKIEDDVLFRWDNEKKNGFVWKSYGDPETHPKYRGEIIDGMPNGNGILNYPDGSMYIGRWIDGQKHGQGVENYSEGSKYLGDSKKFRKTKKKFLSGISPLSE